MIGSNLYPNAISTFDTLEEALAYAEEVAGYRELWQMILQADLIGLFSDN